VWLWFVAGAPAADLKRLSGYAQNIGLAFQIVDDILDITATQEVGKTAGKVCKRKRTPSLWGWKNPSVKPTALRRRLRN